MPFPSTVAAQPLATEAPALAHKVVGFYHPSYPNVALFRLRAFGCVAVDYDLALAACKIVTNNKNGHLTTENGLAVPRPPNTMLTGDKYYYHVAPDEVVAPPDAATNGPTPPYPICPSFNDWRFPHGELPTWWSQDDCAYNHPRPLARSNLGGYISSRDSDRCVLSNTADYIERAHIVPSDNLRWFERELMIRYVESENEKHGIDAAANGTMLRVDLHKSLDAFQWAPLPWGKGWVAYFFNKTDSLGYHFNHRLIRMSRGVAPQLLFARFAMVIFDDLINFISHYRDEGLPVLIAEKVYPAPPSLKTLSPEMTAKILPAARQGSTSAGGEGSKKRSRVNTPQNKDASGFPINCMSNGINVAVEEVSSDDEESGDADSRLFPAIHVPVNSDGSLVGSKRRLSFSAESTRAKEKVVSNWMQHVSRVLDFYTE